MSADVPEWPLFKQDDQKYLNICKVIRVEDAYNHREVRPVYNKQR